MKRRVFKVLFVAVFTTMVGMGIIVPLMGIYAEELGAKGVYLGLIFAAFALSRAVFTPLIGKLSDYRGRKVFILTGLSFYTLFSLAYALCNSVALLISVRFLHGMASAMILPVATTYIGEIAPPDKEGEYMGTFITSLFLGMAAGPLIGGTLTDLFGMNSAFYLMGGLSGLTTLFILKFLPEITPSTKRKRPEGLGQILQNNVVKALMLFRGINAVGLSAVMAFLPLFAGSIKVKPSQIGLIISLNVLLTAILQRSFGKMADRFNKINLIILGSLVVGTALFIIPMTTNFRELLLASIIMGLGSAMAIPASLALATRVGKEKGIGSVMGLFNTAMSLGNVFSPLLSGLVMDLLNLPCVFFTSSGLVFLSTVIFFFLTREGRG
ncbi:MAG: MFS transporter [bacterium]